MRGRHTGAWVVAITSCTAVFFSILGIGMDAWDAAERARQYQTPPWIVLGVVIAIALCSLAYLRWRPQQDRDSSPNPAHGPARPVFRGLRPFEDGDALPLRERDIAKVLALARDHRLVVLHGESGVGKSSLVQAGLTQPLRSQFDEVKCFRLAPSSSNVPAVIEWLSRPTTSSRLLVLDQTEVLFQGPNPEGAKQLIRAVVNSLSRPGLHTLIAIRADAVGRLQGMLQQVEQVEASSKLQVNMYSLSPFDEKEAHSVIEELAGEATRSPLDNDLLEALVSAVSGEDSGTSREKGQVLPVELQMFGQVLEDVCRTGERTSALARFRRFGISQLLSWYWEDVLRYVASRTPTSIGVNQARTLTTRVLGQLAGNSDDGGRPTEFTAQEIGEQLGAPIEDVQLVLNALAERYWVRRTLPPATDPDRATDEQRPQYVLGHDYIARVINTAPDPALIRRRAALERLRFWREQLERQREAEDRGSPAGSRWGACVARLIPRAPLLPLSELIRLRSSAESLLDRQMLRREAVAYGVVGGALMSAVLVAVLVASLVARSNWWQLRQVLRTADPIAAMHAAPLDGLDVAADWVGTIMDAERHEALAYANRMLSTCQSQKERDLVLLTLASVLAQRGEVHTAENYLRQIKSEELVHEAWCRIAVRTATVGDTPTAQTYFRKLQLLPDRPPSEVARAALLRQQEQARYALALAHLEAGERDNAEQYSQELTARYSLFRAQQLASIAEDEVMTYAEPMFSDASQLPEDLAVMTTIIGRRGNAELAEELIARYPGPITYGVSSDLGERARDVMRTGLVRGLAEAGHLEAAEHVSRTVLSEEGRAEASGWVAAELAAQGKLAAADTMLAGGGSSVATLRARTHVADAMDSDREAHHRLQEVLRLLPSVPSDEARRQLAALVGQALAARGEYLDAMGAAEQSDLCGRVAVATAIVAHAAGEPRPRAVTGRAATTISPAPASRAHPQVTAKVTLGVAGRDFAWLSALRASPASVINSLVTIQNTSPTGQTAKRVLVTAELPAGIQYRPGQSYMVTRDANGANVHYDFDEEKVIKSGSSVTLFVDDVGANASSSVLVYCQYSVGQADLFHTGENERDVYFSVSSTMQSGAVEARRLQAPLLVVREQTPSARFSIKKSIRNETTESRRQAHRPLAASARDLVSCIITLQNEGETAGEVIVKDKLPRHCRLVGEVLMRPTVPADAAETAATAVPKSLFRAGVPVMLRPGGTKGIDIEYRFVVEDAPHPDGALLLPASVELTSSSNDVVASRDVWLLIGHEWPLWGMTTLLDHTTDRWVSRLSRSLRIGEVMRFRTLVVNTSRDVIRVGERDVLPPGMRYVPGSLMLDPDISAVPHTNASSFFTSGVFSTFATGESHVLDFEAELVEPGAESALLWNSLYVKGPLPQTSDWQRIAFCYLGQH